MSMTLQSSSKGRVTPSMNVTPLVDVVLVLLITFMVITPLLSKQFYVHLPKEEKKTSAPASDSRPVVLRVAADGSLSLNGVAVAADDVAAKLRRVFAARDDHVLYFDADGEAPYGSTVQALDNSRRGGAVTIAVMVKGTEGRNFQ